VTDFQVVVATVGSRGAIRRRIGASAGLLITLAVLGVTAAPAAARPATLAPFVSHYVYSVEHGHSNVFLLRGLVIDHIGKTVTVFAAESNGAQGTTTFSQRQRGSERILSVRRPVRFGAGSQVLIDLGARSQIGRYKFYRIDPKRHQISVAQSGCSPPGLIFNPSAFVAPQQTSVIPCHPSGVVSPGNCSAATNRSTPILVYPCNGAMLKRGQRSYPFLVEDGNRASTTFHPQIELTSTPPIAGVLPATPGVDGFDAPTGRVTGRTREFDYTASGVASPGYWSDTPGTYYVQVAQAGASIFQSPVVVIHVR
jgi:hypothetical protein